MAVLKSWYVTLFFILITHFLRRSYGDEQEEKYKSVDTLLGLQGFATGYPVDQDSHPYDRQSLNDWSLEELQRKIAVLYDQLECGYLISAQVHLKLTRGFVYENATKAVTRETVKDLLFDVEATMMIDSFRDPNPDRLNHLVFFLMYARQKRFSFRDVVQGGTLNKDILDQHKWFDELMLATINERIENLKCIPDDNCFYVKFDKCEQQQHGEDSTPGETSGEIDDNALKAIRRNKQILHRNFIGNRLLRSSTTESLTDGSLWLFRDDEAYRTFFDEFLAAGSDRFPVRFPGLDSQGNLTGIDPLGEYQFRVIGTLKVIMLQITLAYTKRTGDLPADADSVYGSILKEFRRLMVLEGDADFNDVYDTFKDCHIDDAKLCKSLLTKKIVETIDKITNENHLPSMKSIVTDSDMPLKDVVEVGRSFVEIIEEEIGGNLIKTVQTVLNIIKDTGRVFNNPTK